MRMSGDGTLTLVFALYDHDAGGDRAARTIARDLPEFAGVSIEFERLAVTPAQIARWSLPTRPPKTKDPEAAKWGSKPAVELDAIPRTDSPRLSRPRSSITLTTIGGRLSSRSRRRNAKASMRSGSGEVELNHRPGSRFWPVGYVLPSP